MKTQWHPLAAALLLGLASGQALAGGYVTLPEYDAAALATSTNPVNTLAKLTKAGAVNNAADPLFLGTGATLPANLVQLASNTTTTLPFTNIGGTAISTMGTLYDRVYRDTSDNALVFATRLELDPAAGVEINDIFRNGYSGLTLNTSSTIQASWWAQAATDYRLKAASRNEQGLYQIYNSSNVLIGSNPNIYNVDRVDLSTDTSTPESNPKSGWYFIKAKTTSTRTLSYRLVNNTIGIYRGNQEPNGPVQTLWVSGYQPAWVQVITFPAISDKTLLNTPFTPTVSVDSGLTVTLTSQTPSICSVSGLSVTLIASGTCTLQASQAGDTTNLAATSVSQSFNVTKVAQSISFPAITDKTLLNSPVTPTVSASSGLAVILVSQTPAVCSVSGASVTLAAAGLCTVQASQAGNATYAAATSVSQSFNVTKATQTISFSAIGDKAAGDAPFTLSISASSGLAVALASQTTSVCTVSGSTVTLVSAGLCTLQATQAGNATYASASAVSQSFNINPVVQVVADGDAPLPAWMLFMLGSGLLSAMWRKRSS